MLNKVNFDKLLFKIVTKNGGHELRSKTLYKFACWLYRKGI